MAFGLVYINAKHLLVLLRKANRRWK